MKKLGVFLTQALQELRQVVSAHHKPLGDLSFLIVKLLLELATKETTELNLLALVLPFLTSLLSNALVKYLKNKKRSTRPSTSKEDSCMKILVVGATGATGRLLVQQLLELGHDVRVVVRSAERLPAALRGHERIAITEASLLDLSDQQLAQLVNDCDAVASCLGHNLTFKGIFGPPRRLVTEATRRLCAAIAKNQPTKPTKFVLMNTAGNRNRDLPEPISLAQSCVIGLIRFLVPPHADNEEAADYLRTQIGRNHKFIEWTAVRPDSLNNTQEITPYELHTSPTRSAIFNPGKTSRKNVAHVMAELIGNNQLWQQWRGQMPVVYDCE